MSALRVGHFEKEGAGCGCTVFLFERPNRAVASIRGGAPGSRELGVLTPGNLVEGVDAIFFTGGSAPGLRVADGIVDFLLEREIGYSTPAGIIPIVAGGVIYDLELGERVFPEREWGKIACERVSSSPREGTVGAGAGATVGKAGGIKYALKGGFGWGKSEVGGRAIHAFTVTNSLGAVYHPETGQLIAGPEKRGAQGASISEKPAFFNTTLTLIVLEANFSREELLSLSQVVHSALASCIRPFATLYDGDIIFLVSQGKGKIEYLPLVFGVYQSVFQAVLNAVGKARGIAGIPAVSELPG